MKRSPELKPNFWDGIVVLAVIPGTLLALGIILNVRRKRR